MQTAWFKQKKMIERCLKHLKPSRNTSVKFKYGSYLVLSLAEWRPGCPLQVVEVDQWDAVFMQQGFAGSTSCVQAEMCVTARAGCICLHTQVGEHLQFPVSIGNVQHNSLKYASSHIVWGGWGLHCKKIIVKFTVAYWPQLTNNLL